MKKAEDYREEIVKLIYSVDDAVFLRRIYKLLCIVIKIDDPWMLKEFDIFLDNIQK